MEYAKTLVRKLVKEEDGGEVLEYALIAGLIVIAAIAAIQVFSGSLNNKVNNVAGDIDATN